VTEARDLRGAPAARELRGTLAARGAELARQQPELLAGAWRRRLPVLALGAAALALYVAGFAVLGVSPSVLVTGARRLADIAGLMIPPDPRSWDHALFYLEALGQTLAIAFVGTLLAALIGFPLGFIAARNVVANRIVHLLARRSLDTLRSVDTLIWALIWINVVGLGPFAGALAIMTSDLGSFGKLGSEALEAAERGPVDGVLSAGGSKLQGVRFGMLPQVLPVFLSQVLYFFESNTRSATIIGIVGAGGIGLQLSEQIRVLEWQQVSFLILMVLVTVAAIDALSQRLRGAIIGRRG
jgi:phosphonate transport system permease protein